MNNGKLNTEYDILKRILKENYNIEIDEPEIESISTLCVKTITALNIWKKNLELSDSVINESLFYFNEIISNILHVAILSAIKLKIPTAMMLRRSQENLLNFIYYSEHRIELFKKEINDDRKNFNSFKDLKDYINDYPYSIRYSIQNQMVSSITKELLSDWSNQYKRLSHFVHGSNSKYMENAQNFDELKIDSKELKQIKEEIVIFLEVLNVLLIIFFFNDYKGFEEHTEKSFIRNCISGKRRYKSKIADTFKEI